MSKLILPSNPKRTKRRSALLRITPFAFDLDEMNLSIFRLKYRIGDIPCYWWGKRATGGKKRSERWAVGSGEWAVLIVETLVTPHCPPPTAHRPGFRVRAKLGIDFPLVAWKVSHSLYEPRTVTRALFRGENREKHFMIKGKADYATSTTVTAAYSKREKSTSQLERKLMTLHQERA